MASTYLSRTLADPGGAGNRNKWTFSAWIKRSELGTNQWIFGSYQSANYNTALVLKSDDTLQFFDYYNGSFNGQRRTNRVFRDPSAWYHIVAIWDKDNATTSEKMRIFVNGTEETSFSASSAPSNATTLNADGQDLSVGYKEGVGEYFNGLMSHVHFCDGYAYNASYFGQTDSNGVWTIKTSPSVSYGTTGFFILKNGNSGTDQSGNGNDLTVGGGTLTNTEDNPSNVFATLNPLDKGYTGTIVLANGNNTTMASTGAGDYGLRSTLAVTSGKYYWEVKISDSDAFGILPMEDKLIFDMYGGTPEPDLYGVQRSTDTLTNFFNDATFISGNTAWGGITSSDITGFALDMDNGKLFLSKNGVFKAIDGTASDPVAGTNPTFTISDTNKTYGFYVELRSNVNNGLNVNFGNGYFGSTPVASAGTNASGIGIFEHDVPNGYTALSTKGLNL